MRFARYFFGVIVVYFLAWTASYILTWVLRGDPVDFAYYFDYLVAAWTFGGLEGLPQFMLLGSIVLFIPLVVAFVLVLRRHRTHGHPQV